MNTLLSFFFFFALLLVAVSLFGYFSYKVLPVMRKNFELYTGEIVELWRTAEAGRFVKKYLKDLRERGKT
jgi:hypothetical protein